MKNEYIKLIVEIDKVISMLRGLWLDAENSVEADKWYMKINKALEERSRLMLLRDKKRSISLECSDDDL